MTKSRHGTPLASPATSQSLSCPNHAPCQALPGSTELENNANISKPAATHYD